MATPFVTGAVTGWWIQGTIFQLENLTGLIFWWWWWPTCSFYLQGMHFSSETQKLQSLWKFVNATLLTWFAKISPEINFTDLEYRQIQLNIRSEQKVYTRQKTSGRRKMMTILEIFWQNWIILDTQLLTFMSQKWKVFVCIFPFGEYVLLCDKDILFSVELKVWTV